MHTNKTMKLAVVAFLGISLAAAGTAVAGRGSSPQAVRWPFASGSPDAIKSELERAEHLVCVSCVDMVMPLIDNNDQGIRQVAAWWLARRGVARTVRVRDADPAGAARLGRRAQRGGRAGRVPLRVVHPGAVGGAVEPGVLQRGAGAHGARPSGRISRPEVVAPLTGALVDERRRGPGGRDAGPAVDRRPAGRRRGITAARQRRRRRACGGGDDAGDVPRRQRRRTRW